MIISNPNNIYHEKGELEADILISINQSNCQHEKHRKFIDRTFDILNGFEIIASRCSNCHKTIELRIRKMA
jgi:hypothetical protein